MCVCLLRHSASVFFSQSPARCQSLDMGCDPTHSWSRKQTVSQVFCLDITCTYTHGSYIHIYIYIYIYIYIWLRFLDILFGSFVQWMSILANHSNLFVVKRTYFCNSSCTDDETKQHPWTVLDCFRYSMISRVPARCLEVLKFLLECTDFFTTISSFQTQNQQFQFKKSYEIIWNHQNSRGPLHFLQTSQGLWPVRAMEKTAVTCVAWLPRGVCSGRLDGAQDFLRSAPGARRWLDAKQYWNQLESFAMDNFYQLNWFFNIFMYLHQSIWIALLSGKGCNMYIHQIKIRCFGG